MVKEVKDRASGKKTATPSLAIRARRDGTVTARIVHGGKAGRMFLLDATGNFIQVVGPDEYVKIFHDPKTARSKRGLGKGKTQYLASKAVIKGSAEEGVTDMVKAHYGDVAKLFTNGELKGRSKTAVKIIPLV